MKQIRIVSDGTSNGTQIFDENGIEMTNIKSILISPISARSGLVTAKIEFVNVQVDIHATSAEECAAEEHRNT